VTWRLPHLKQTFIVVLVLTALAAATITASAQAGSFSFKNLPGKTWTTNGEVVGMTQIHAQWSNLTGCIGPVQKSGSEYVFPDGWDCGSPQGLTFEFGLISAAAGFDNPNSGTIKEGGVSYN